MMSRKPFEFEKTRDFGAVIGDALQFFTRNFKSFLIGFLTYVGPFLLVGIFAMILAGNAFFAMLSASPGDLPSFPMSFLIVVPAVIMASIMTFALAVGGVQKYRAFPDEPIIDGLWPYVRRGVGKIFVASLLLIALLMIPSVLVFALIGVVPFVGVFLILFLWLPAAVYFMIPCMIFLMVHAYEENPLWDSLKRGFMLVKENWWSTFAVYLVISILASVASYIFMIPGYIVMLVQMVGSGVEGMGQSMGMWFGVMYACALFGSMFIAIYQVLGLSLQYFSLREKKEGTTLMRRIEQLGEPDTENFV